MYDLYDIGDRMNYRLRKLDSLNWVIEKRILPTEIKKGPRKGQMTEGDWKIQGYYGRLQDVPVALLEKCIPIGEYKDIPTILRAVRKAHKEAEAIIIKALTNADI